MTFDEWWALQPKDPTKPIDPRMAWEAAEYATGFGLLKTMLSVFDIMDNPAQFRSALAAAVAKREAPNIEVSEGENGK